jgi:hypothetical protein
LARLAFVTLNILVFSLVRSFVGVGALGVQA